MVKELSSLSLSEFLAQSPGLHFIADSEARILAVSQQLAALLKAEAGSNLTQQRLAELVPEEARPALLQSFQRAMADGTSVEVSVPVVAAEGQIVALSGLLQRGSGHFAATIFGTLWPQPTVVVPTAQPISTLLPTTGKDYLEAITEHLPVVLWAIDINGVFIYHEGKGLASAGLKPRQFLGQNLFQLYSEENSAMVRSALKGEVSHSLSEAHGIAWESWILPLRGEDGAVSGAVGCTLDVSENARTQKELKERIETIQEQQRIIKSLSTPIIQVWDQVLTLPLFGHVDSSRAGSLMENLLREVVRTRARFAILDLTGVDMIDTATAGHLMSLIRALGLLGTEGIITGIKANIAQTVVGLGVDLTGITTLSTLQAGLHYCMERLKSTS